ncbi:MAG: AIR synthase related protein, partial [Candidatus Sumerlaeia bacterium]|nr:AIR synthase related protein [Candidatus Sumerlaeia bacterium]
LALLSSPTIASKRWIYQQYDHMVQTNTVVRPGENSAVLRLRGTHKFLAITADCNGLYCYLDPYQGAAIAVAEAARNLAVVGARPLAITNCLNFGNPTKPEIFYQFTECVRGMGEACRMLNTPVTGGNVSFYNEYEGRAVYPTPVIGMIGVIEAEEEITTSGFKKAGDAIILIEPQDVELHLGGSHYLEYLHRRIMAPCPELNLVSARDLILIILELIKKKLINSAHDLSEGGLAVALAESLLRADKQLGAEIHLSDRWRADIQLFSEAQSRLIVSANPAKVSSIESICKNNGFNASVIGTVIAEPELKIGKLLDVSKKELLKYYEKFPW